MRELLKSKIHRARITDAHLDYEGSITLDTVLMEAANLREFEKVLVVDLQSGSRFETYCIKGKAGSGEVVVNGAASRLVQIGDLVIVMAFTWLSEELSANHNPLIVKVDADNRPR